MLAMPQLTSIDGQPEEVRAAIDVIGNQVRTEILRRLSLEALTAPQLANVLGVNRFSVLRHLGVLESLGLVLADRPSGERRGVSVHWTTDPARVAQIGDGWAAYARGK